MWRSDGRREAAPLIARTLSTNAERGRESVTRLSTPFWLASGSTRRAICTPPASAAISHFPCHSAVGRSVLRLPDTVYRATYLRELTQRSRQEYLSAGITFLIASSDVFGPVFARPAEHPGAYDAYRLFHDAAECLPSVEPTATVAGPEIRICRFLTP